MTTTWHDNCKSSDMKLRIIMMLALTGFGAEALAQDDWAALPDPTRPIGAARAAPAGGLALQSTLVSPSRRIAVINGRTVGVGERIGDAVVADIRPYEVVLDRNGRETRLRMLPRLDKEKTDHAAHDHAPE